MAKSEIRLTGTRIAAGVWEGVLTGTGAEAPVLEVVQGDRVLDGVTVTALKGKAGQHAVRVPIPAEVLSDGVQSFLIRSGGETLATFTIVTGAEPGADIRAEIDLLRAELEVLKRAFRRHCAETAG